MIALLFFVFVISLRALKLLNHWINVKNVGSSWIFRKNKIFKISKRVLNATRF